MRIMDMPEFKDKSQVLTFDQDDRVCDAVDAMGKKNYGAVLVTSKDRLCGIFTERDLLRRVAACRLDLEGLKLREVMTTNLKTAKETDKVTDCLHRMSQGRFRHLPVVDEKGNLLGMFSQGDFVAFTIPQILHRFGEAARAGIDSGNSTPFSMLLAILVYTLVLVFTVAGLGFWLSQ